MPLSARVCDELPFGFGWIAEQPAHLQRASHALAEDGRVWLIDPVDAPELEARIKAFGKVAGVIQLLARHARDGAALARRWEVPLHRAFGEGVPGSPFRTVRVVSFPRWREAALWWPEQRTLVVADAFGTASYFLGPGELLAVHPLLRLLPPRTLGSVAPEHVLCGHGEGVHGAEAAGAVRDALQNARGGIPRWLVGVVRRGKG